MPRGVYGAALEFLAERFKGTFREIPTTVSVGVSATQVAAVRADRVHLTIVNLSGADVWIAPSNQVSSGFGLHIDANGGAVSMNVDQDGSLPVSEWWAVAGAAAMNVWVLEVVRETLLHD